MNSDSAHAPEDFPASAAEPDVHILLPFWGDPDHLFTAVHSVLDQSDPRWRLTVLDDAYPDPRVAVFFAELDDSRVDYVRHPENIGITRNFRRAAELASAPLCCIFGSDDIMGREFVATVRDLARRSPDASIIQPAVEVLDDRGMPHLPLVDRVKQRLLAPRGHNRTARLRGQDLAASLLQGNWLYWPSLVFRTPTLQRHDFPDDLPIILDLALLVDIAFDDGELVYAPGPPVFGYRRHAASLSQRALVDGSRFRDERRFYRTVAARARARGWRRAYAAARLRLFSRLHAVTVLPTAFASRNRAGIASTLAHVFAF